MAITTALTASDNCIPSAGGVAEIYLTNQNDIDSVTETSAGVTAITMKPEKLWFAAEPTVDTAQFDENGEQNDNGSTVFTQSIIGDISGCSDAADKWITDAYDQGNCGTAVIHKENAGCWRFWGGMKNRGVKLKKTEKTTGKTLQDANKTAFTIQAVVPKAGKAKKFVPGEMGDLLEPAED